MGGKTQKVTNTTKLPAYLESAYKSLIPQAQQVAQTPYDPATEQQVAGFAAPQAQAFNQVQNTLGIQSPYINQAAGIATNAAGPISSAAIGNYLNPYQSDVINATLAQINQQNQIQQNQLKGNAVAQGALGGDRAAVAKAVLAGQQGMNTASALAGLNAQNYNQALAAAQGDQARALQAGQQIAGLGAQAQGANTAEIAALLGIGGLQQGQQQNVLNAATQNAQQQQQYPFQTTQWLQQILSGLAPSAGGTTTQSQPGPSPISQIAGLGLTAASLFSDERIKEGIEPVGKTFDGQTIYRFRYRGDPHTQIGLMAQDVERSHPQAVGSDHGIKTVDYDQATSDAALRGRFADGGWSSSPLLMAGLGMLASPRADPLSGLTSGLQMARDMKDQKPLLPETGKTIGTALSGLFGGGRNLSGFAEGGSTGDSRMATLLSRVNHATKGVHAIRNAAGPKGYADGGFPDDTDIIDFDDDLIGTGPVSTSSARSLGAADLIKGFEGYSPVAKWDRRQYSGGYGTRAKPGERFTPETAEARLNQEIHPVDDWLGRNVTAPMTPSQKAALTSFGYNLGTDDLAKLLPDINRGDWGTVGQRMLSFNKALNNQTGQLEEVPGLTDRRQKEAALLAGAVGAPSVVAPAATSAAQGAPPQTESPSFFDRISANAERNLPLLAAGLGMLASRSPFVGTAIGEGGLQGIQALMQQRARDRQVNALKQQMQIAQQRMGIQNEALAERRRHNQAIEGNAGQPAFSKNVIWGVGPDGKPALLQPGTTGEAIATKLPEGYSVAKEPIKLDAGTKFVLLDPQTRQVIGEIPKNITEEAQEKKYGQERGELEAKKPQAILSTKTAVSGLDRMNDAIAQLKQMSGLASATGNLQGRSWMPNIWQSTADADAAVRNLKGKVATTALQAMRDASKSGGAVGSVTEKEWPILESMIANLDPLQGDALFVQRLDELQDYARGAKERLLEAYKNTYKEDLAVPAAPSAEDLKSKYGLE